MEEVFYYGKSVLPEFSKENSAMMVWREVFFNSTKLKKAFKVPFLYFFNQKDILELEKTSIQFPIRCLTCIGDILPTPRWFENYEDFKFEIDKYNENDAVGFILSHHPLSSARADEAYYLSEQTIIFHRKLKNNSDIIPINLNINLFSKNDTDDKPLLNSDFIYKLIADEDGNYCLDNIYLKDYPNIKEIIGESIAEAKDEVFTNFSEGFLAGWHGDDSYNLYLQHTALKALSLLKLGDGAKESGLIIGHGIKSYYDKWHNKFGLVDTNNIKALLQVKSNNSDSFKNYERSIEIYNAIFSKDRAKIIELIVKFGDLYQENWYDIINNIRNLLSTYTKLKNIYKNDNNYKKINKIDFSEIEKYTLKNDIKVNMFQFRFLAFPEKETKLRFQFADGSITTTATYGDEVFSLGNKELNGETDIVVNIEDFDNVQTEPAIKSSTAKTHAMYVPLHLDGEWLVTDSKYKLCKFENILSKLS